MDYIKNFSDSFKLWWNHKYLWIIGILGVLVSGAGATAQIQNAFKSDSPYFKDTFLDSPAIVIIAIVIALITFAIAVVGIYLQLRAQSSLIQSAKLIRSDKTLNFKQAWALGNKYLLKLLINSLLLSLPVFLLIFILVIFIILGVLSLPTPLLAIPFFLIAFVIFLLIFTYILLAALISPISERFVVLEGKTNMQAIKLAISFVKNNLGSLIMVWLVLIGVNIIISIVTFPVSLLLTALALPAFALLSINPVIGLIGLVVSELIISALTSVIAGPQSALTSLYWTNSYLEIKQEQK